MGLIDLVKQKLDLERPIASAQAQSRRKAIADVQALTSGYGLMRAISPDDRGRQARRSPHARRPLPAKFTDEHENAW